jgi:putative transposase
VNKNPVPCPVGVVFSPSLTALDTTTMPRIARVVLPGVPLHIIQRGIRQFDVFRDDADRKVYLKLLAESCGTFALRISAYCLMTNHVHFVAIPERPDSVWRTFHRCHGTYASRFNKKYGLAGHLWQARPFSSALDEAHFWCAIRYVERNPLRARMVEQAEHYVWSSAGAHCGQGEDPLLHPEWRHIAEIQNWTQWISLDNASGIDDRIRERTFTGRPCGDDSFVRRTEQLLDRQLTRKKPGPKPKTRTPLTG